MRYRSYDERLRKKEEACKNERLATRTNHHRKNDYDKQSISNDVKRTRPYDKQS